MRRFKSKDFHREMAKGIESSFLRTPDNKSRLALAYLRQFVHLTDGHSELKRGYISESFIDALLQVSDESGSEDFGSAIECIGGDGRTSTTVTEYNELTLIEVENSVDAKNSIWKIISEQEDELSDEAVKNLQTIQDLIRINSGIITYYLPREVADEILGKLDKESVLL